MSVAGDYGRDLAAEAMDSKTEWIERVLGVKVGDSSDAAGDGTAPGGMAAWTRARAKAIGTLTEVEKAIRAMQDPDGDQAIIEVRSIRANLTESPTTPQQIAELERYLQTDTVIDDVEIPNGFGIKVELRTPLLAAVAALKSEHTAKAGALS